MTAMIFLLALVGSLIADPQDGAAALVPVGLRCEHRTEPRGIDETRPQLSWLLEAVDPKARGLAQASYHVLVSATEARLSLGEGELWDSGEVRSGSTYAVDYAGRPLESGMVCFWKVRVRDGSGALSDWSEPASFNIGLLDAADWEGAWIGYDAARALAKERPHLRDAHWIQFPEEDPRQAPAGTRAFRKLFELPADLSIDEATLLVTADDGFDLYVNGRHAVSSDLPDGTWKRARIARIEHLLTPGRNLLAVETRNASAGPTGLIGQLVIRRAPPSTRAPFLLETDATWNCSREQARGWEQPGFDDFDWLPVRDAGQYGVDPWGPFPAGDLLLPPASYLRHTFQVEKPVLRATAYASALGLYEMRLNGRRVGDQFFDPGWTDYEKRVYYRAFDVTSLLHPGANAIGAILGDGWYSGYVGYKPERDHYGKHPRFRAHVEIEYRDGNREVVASDAGWRATTGPILESDFLMGEVYDARRELPGWDESSYDASDWQPVDVTERIAARLETHPGQPVRAITELVPKKVTEPKPGVYVVDLGQNFAGFCRLRLKGRRGQVVTLRFAERLNPDGTIYTTNLRAARVVDTYVCKGGGKPEIFEPRFTFHGFQYVEVSGLDTPPTKEMITGVALSSDTPLSGRFECSDPMVNQLVSNILWTQRANFIDVPTDCPQRDERLGWTGDAQIYVRTAALLSDVQAFFTKWLVDLEDAQRADGQFPMVAPLKVAGADGGPGWADAGVICPWAIYQVYGDLRCLEERYDGMVKFLEFCRGRSTDGLLPPEKFHCFGDWVSVDADTPKTVIYTAYYAHAADLVARSAEALGRVDDAVQYRKLFSDIKAAFRKAYINADGRIEGNTQCAYVMALAFDLVEGGQREAAAEHLIERIEARQGHLSTGFLGTKDLMLVLSKIGREDVAYRLLHNESYPSWGFSIRNGATSIWERWNGWTPEKGFMDPGMNSFAHYSFGAVGQWLFENVGGIQPETPGYERILIRPRPGGKIDWARVEYESVRGRIATHWTRKDGRFHLEVDIPPNTTATIHLPAREGGRVTESGVPAAEAPGLEFTGWIAGAALFEAGSGHYAFVSEVE